MIKEIEITGNGLRRELETVLRADSVIVGSGIMGLLAAKRLTDLGQRVVLLEKSPTLANGASVKNHGWLHRGTAHAVSIKDESEARQVVRKLIYGYDYIRSYAPECIEEPFEPVFAVTRDPARAEFAVQRWRDLGVFYEEVSRDKFFEIDPFIAQDPKLQIFRSLDLTINNRILFQKLVTDIYKGGGVILNNVDLSYEDEETVALSRDGKKHKVRADTFIHSPGNGMGQDYRSLTGQELQISFWKSHLLSLPRFSPYSIVSLDRDEPIIINHTNVSIINRAYDEVPSDQLNLEIDDEEVRRSFESLRRLYPQVDNLKNQLRAVVCAKPSIQLKQDGRHSVNSQIIEPIVNHLFVLPGKMTEAPYVVDNLLHRIYNRLDFNEVTKRPVDLLS